MCWIGSVHHPPTCIIDTMIAAIRAREVATLSAVPALAAPRHGIIGVEGGSSQPQRARDVRAEMEDILKLDAAKPLVTELLVP